jgi:hypothetical protein
MIGNWIEKLHVSNVTAHVGITCVGRGRSGEVKGNLGMTGNTTNKRPYFRT